MPKQSLHLPDIASADQLLDFFRGQLNWPLPKSLPIEEIFFDWTDGELRLSESASQHLRGGIVRQIRTPIADQPWGMFLVEFASTHIYRTALRQILRGLVPSAHPAPALKAWRHDNLQQTRDARPPKQPGVGPEMLSPGLLVITTYTESGTLSQP